jgi:hypothetical protein
MAIQKSFAASYSHQSIEVRTCLKNYIFGKAAICGPSDGVEETMLGTIDLSVIDGDSALAMLDSDIFSPTITGITAFPIDIFFPAVISIVHSF